MKKVVCNRWGLFLFLLTLPLFAGAGDKMDDLGLTPEGMPKPAAVAKDKTPKIHLAIYDKKDAVYDMKALPLPEGFATMKIADKADTIIKLLFKYDTDLLSGAVYDGVVSSDKETIEARFTFPKGMKNVTGWADSEGIGLGGSLSDCLFANLEELQNFSTKYRREGEQQYMITDGGEPNQGTDMTPDGPDTTTSEPQKEGSLNSQNGARPTGGLTGKAVYLNPGHGYVWRGTNNDSFGIQRGFVHNNIEDFSNADLMCNYLMPYIWNAGGDVFSVRESDTNPNMVIVDNDDTARTDGYGFSKTGTWNTSSVSAFKNGVSPYTSGTNPFAQGTALMTSCVSSATPSATATWAAQIPATGWYNVYVTQVAYTNRASAAKYKVYHAGGVTDCTLDHRRWRNAWVPLGRFFFEKNAPANQAKVVLNNAGFSTNTYITADAVRWGGGKGVIKRGKGTSGQLRYLEEARYHLQFMGLPDVGTDSTGSSIGYNASSAADTDSQVDEKDGWTARPRFARYMYDKAKIYGAPAQDSVFLSSHTNAYNGEARGYGTYIRSDAPTDYLTYGAKVHDTVFDDCKAIFNKTPGPWYDRGKHKSGENYGEANHNTANMPTLLGEWLFHDNASDMQLYHHPRFKQAMARGIMRGIIQYWNYKGKISLVYPPEPITNLCVLQKDASSVVLTWGKPPTAINGRAIASAATGYKIWMSEHGRAFPNVKATLSSTAAVPTYTVTGLTPGKTYYFKVTATNAGGESQAGDTLAVRTESNVNAKKILIVQGFNKLDPSTRVNTSYGSGVSYRHLLDRMNSYDYIFEHMKGIDAYCKAKNIPIKVDSCNKDSINGKWVLLGGYDAVIWMSGIEAEVATFDCWDDTSIAANSRTAIKEYLATNGKAFFISGSELAWELDSKAVDASFLNSTLKADYVSDSSNVYSVKPVAGSIFEGLDDAIPFDDGSDVVRPGYQVQWADVIKPLNGSTAALAYGAGQGTQLDAFEDAGSWQQPGYSSQSSGLDASSMDIDTSVAYEGNASMKISVTWGSGTTLREYNAGLPTFTFGSGDTISYMVYGDNSNTTLCFMLRDSDGDLLYHNPILLNFTGWKKFAWKYEDPFSKFAGGGDGAITGPVRVDSFFVRKGSSATSNTFRIDDLRVSGTGNSSSDAVAAIQWGTPTTSRLVYIGFPFETILDETKRNNVMARVIEFLLPPYDAGSVTVNISPAGAVTAGAQWSIDGGTTWNASGATVSGVKVGTQTITFKTISGWDAPAAKTVTIVKDSTITQSATYVQQLGNLTVTITPQGAINAGAQWSIDGGTTWNVSGATKSYLPIGTYTVTFKQITNWTTPTSKQVTVTKDTTVTTTGEYVSLIRFGSIKVTITPEAAANAGAQWTIDDGTTWNNSGVTLTEIPVGTYTVFYSTVNGWEQPPAETVEITEQQTSNVPATYTSLNGTLTVNITPAEAVTAGAQWSVDGGMTWNDSGTIITLAAGDYTVQFKEISGWLSPVPQSVQIQQNQLTSAEGVYEYSVTQDIILQNGNFSVGTAGAVAPGVTVDMSWDVSASQAVTAPVWFEVFGSKTGGFDQVRTGATMTYSYKKTDGLSANSSQVKPSNLVLNTVTDGVYTLIPSVNRATLKSGSEVAIPEMNYTNNWLPVAGKRLSVHNPNQQDIDLSLSDVQVLYNPIQPTKVSFTGKVTNTGSVDMTKPGAWVEVFYGTLTAEGTLMPQGTIGAGQNINTLAAGESANFSLSGTVTAGVMNRAFAVVADSTDIVPEKQEVNNSYLVYDPSVLPPGKDNGIDLAITNMSVDASQLVPNSVAPGSKLKYSLTIQNKGTVMPSDKVYVELFASQDGCVSSVPGVTLCFSKQIDAPALGASQTYQFEQTINSIGDGMYTLLAVVNRAAVATNPGDETPLDNRYAYNGGRVFLSTPASGGSVNLVWSDGPYFEPAPEAGNRIRVHGTVKNVGDIAARAFWTEAFVGTVQEKTGVFYKDTATVFAAGQNGGSTLAPGAEREFDVTGRVDAGQVVGVLIDSTDVVAETDETDNYDYSELLAQ